MTSFLHTLAQPTVFPWVCLVFGLCIGSFLNVVIYRLPKVMERDWLADIPAILEETKEVKDPAEVKMLASKLRDQISHLTAAPFNMLVPRSRCPACGHQISALENIPLVSFSVQRGRCSNCKTRISLKYPVVEALTGLATAFSAWHFGFGLSMLGASVFIWCTIALAFIDQETGFLPDQITLPLLWFGILLNTASTFVPLHQSVIGAAAGYLSLWSVYWLYKLIRGKEGMGYGDFKMNAAVGALLGWKILPVVILISSVVGLFFGLIQMVAARGRWDVNFRIHFGPYIAIAGVLAMFWGSEISRYLGLPF